MNFDLSMLQPKEQASFALRALYETAGCRQYHMGRFEEYALYQENRSFLSSEQVITFTDLDGRLLALKPDVTLSIAKTAQPAPRQTLQYYYSENVYRPSAESHTFKEIAQMGLEYIGVVEQPQMQEVIGLAAASLEVVGGAFVLEISHMGYISGLFDALALPASARPKILALLHGKNPHELRAAALAAGVGDAGATALGELLTLCGDYSETLARAEQLCRSDAMRDAVAELRALEPTLRDCHGTVRLDLSLAGDMEYYNGLVFQGYLQGVPRPLLKGGRYDLLIRKFTPGASAVGFAVYLDEMDRLRAPSPLPLQADEGAPVMLNVALPKGRLGDKVYKLLESIGYGCPEDYNATRKLVVENPAAGIRYFLVKPSDVAIYVEHGAADVGIVGKDILTEADADVYELLDTHLGKCRMCVAAPADYRDDPSRPVRVATKFVRIAKDYYASVGRDIDIIKLNGSIELAPLLGLSDVIVDIVETGTTLRENGLKVVTEFLPISARFIANKASYQFKHREIDHMLEQLREIVAQG
jgi:ATP phosphoribosyltransferase regulatory subunit